MLRAPGAELDPWNKDRFVFVPEPVEEAAKAQQKEPLEPSDVDVSVCVGICVGHVIHSCVWQLDQCEDASVRSKGFRIPVSECL